MEEFIRTYGIWILLVGVFLAMQWFGMGCGGRHRHRSGSEESVGEASEEKKQSIHSGGCH